MKIEKNKIVFASVLAVVILFIVCYSLLMLKGDQEEEGKGLKQTSVPLLQSGEKQYRTKLDAINDLKEVKESNAPSIYDEKLLDSLGNYDPDLLDKKKERVVDSIYKSARIRYSEDNYQNLQSTPGQLMTAAKDPIESEETETTISIKEMGLDHQLFFASAPKGGENALSGLTDSIIYVEVAGEQVVKVHSRLRMRLIKDAKINGIRVPENTLLYGFISFQPNRAQIEIENIDHHPVKLTAYDLQDGSKGIYVENSFRADATREVLGDVVDDINIAGVPQIGGIKKVFQRNNRNIKVTVSNNYKILLKPVL